MISETVRTPLSQFETSGTPRYYEWKYMSFFWDGNFRCTLILGVKLYVPLFLISKLQVQCNST